MATTSVLYMVEPWGCARLPLNPLHEATEPQFHCCLVAKSCLTLCDPMDYSLPGSSVHVILQARILEWVAISFSRGSFERSILHLLHWQVDLLPLSHLGSSEPHFTIGLNRGGLQQRAGWARPDNIMFSALNCSQDCPPSLGGYILGQCLLPSQSAPLRECSSGQNTHHVGWSCSL